MNTHCVVIPSNRDLSCLNDWSETDLSSTHIILVEDNDNKTIELPKGFDITHYCRKDIEEDLKENSWIISKGDSAIKSYGLMKAYQDGADFISCIDDDVISQHPQFFASQRQFLGARAKIPYRNRVKLFTTLGIPDVPQKGLPEQSESDAPVTFVYGLWYGYADVPAKYIKDVGMPSYNNPNIPVSVYYKDALLAISGMNVSMKSDLIPAYYQPLMGEGYMFGKWADTWSGLFLQKIMHHLGMAMICGQPVVFHQHYGDNTTSLEKEKLGYALNEFLWDQIPQIQLESKTVRTCYVELADKLPSEYTIYSSYLKKLKEAMKIWANYF